MLKILENDGELDELRTKVRRWPRRLAVAAAALGLVALVLWAAGRATARLPETTPVRVGTAVLAVYGTGNVEPVNWAKLATAVSARLMSLDVKEGDPVRKGQVLAAQEDRVERATLAELEARQRFYESDLERKEKLAGRDIVSQQTLGQTRASAEEYAAKVRAQKERIGLLSLVSPIDGVVLRRDGELGELMAAGTTVLWVGDPKEINVVAAVDEEDIGFVREGQRVLVKSDAQPGRPIEGRVVRVTPKGDPVAKTFRVRVAIPAGLGLMVGMTTEINIVVRETRDALLVPASAVAEGHAWRLDGETLVRFAVETGIKSGSDIEVTKGLAPGDRVAVSAAAAKARSSGGR